ncbi:type VII secretion protein EccB [Kribbella sp. CA-293567]|uniref:type VII secretion protein EccB n=1 Tax=Kribbella sp. CA-293567 TaxID=3002436 RepID=UPI0022DD7DBE|nr:type VII secretion protein EccB [Kribbella sp. CA-293567]WBQ08431.1 type VII secretion protein EccB [Kribbella sp. CA-293567]
MATRKDQLQAHQFSVQRMTSALVTRETDPEQPPFKRPLAAAFGSIAILALALVVAGVYGMVAPGGSKVGRSGDVVVVEKETGTRFVYVDGHLHPVTNYSSALLALGKYGESKRVSRRSLASIPRGPLIGINDAPDALPDRKRLLTGAWTLCSEPALDVSGAAVSESVLMVGSRPARDQQMLDDAMLVEVLNTGEQYLIWKGYRHRLQRSAAIDFGPLLGPEPWARVGAAFVAALPDGDPIAPIITPGLGKPSTAVPGRKGTLIGQLFVVTTPSGSRQYYVALKDRLRPITELQYGIQSLYRPITAAYGGRAPTALPLGLVSLGRAEAPSTRADEGQAPRTLPQFVAPRNGRGTVCAAYQPGSAVPAISIDAAMPARDQAAMTVKRGKLGTALADRILVEPGAAAIVEAMPSDQARAGTVLVITDLGRAYPLADPQLLETLGYKGVVPIRIPAQLVARIPQGSGLDLAAAVRPVV